MPQDNPFDDTPKMPGKKKLPPQTQVEVNCPGCLNKYRKTKVFNIRARNEDFKEDKEQLVKVMHCNTCHWQFELIVSMGGGITVWNSNEFGAYRKQIAFRKVWQDKHG